MRIEGEARDEEPFFGCGIRTAAGTFGGVIDFLLDTGPRYTMLRRADFRRLRGDFATLRLTEARPGTLSGGIPCHALLAVILEFRPDTEAQVEMPEVLVPDEELWGPNLLGRDFLLAGGWEFRYQPAQGVCELITPE